MKHYLLDKAHLEYNIARSLLSDTYPNGPFMDVGYHISKALSLCLESYLIQRDKFVHSDNTISTLLSCAKSNGYTKCTYIERMLPVFDAWLSYNHSNTSYALIDKAFDIFAISYNYVMDCKV